MLIGHLLFVPAIVITFYTIVSFFYDDETIVTLIKFLLIGILSGVIFRGLLFVIIPFFVNLPVFYFVIVKSLIIEGAILGVFVYYISYFFGEYFLNEDFGSSFIESFLYIVSTLLGIFLFSGIIEYFAKIPFANKLQYLSMPFYFFTFAGVATVFMYYRSDSHDLWKKIIFDISAILLILLVSGFYYFFVFYHIYLHFLVILSFVGLSGFIYYKER